MSDNIELIVGENEIEISKNDISADLTVGEYEITLEKPTIQIEITKGEHEIEIIEPDPGIDEINLEIESKASEIEIVKDEISVDIGDNVVEVELVGPEQLIEVLKGDVELELVAQASIIHTNPEALPEEAFCSAAEVVGDCVYIYDDKFTDKPVVRKCDITDKTKMPCVALITEKITNTECKIKKIGEVSLYSGLTAGAMIVVGANGQPVMPINLPDPSITPHYVQVIGVSNNPDTVLLHINMTVCKRI